MKFSITFALSINMLFASVNAIQGSEELESHLKGDAISSVDTKNDPEDLGAKMEEEELEAEMAKNLDMPLEIDRVALEGGDDPKAIEARRMGGGYGYGYCYKQKDCTPGYCYDYYCYDGDKGDPCSGGHVCKGSLQCLKHKCDKAGFGDPCDYDDQCKHGYYCLKHTCWNGNTGNPCTSDSQCVTGDKKGLCKHHECTFHTVTVDSGLGGEGDSCTSDSKCKHDYYCHKHKCYNGDEGDPCSKDRQCKSGGKSGHCEHSKCVYSSGYGYHYDDDKYHYSYDDKYHYDDWYHYDDDWYHYDDNWYHYDDNWYSYHGPHLPPSGGGQVGDSCKINADCAHGNYCFFSKCYNGSQGDPCRHHFECKGRGGCFLRRCSWH